MHRRKFLAATALAGIGAMAVLSSQLSLKRKTKDFLKSILHFLKSVFHLPEEGKNISVETALNSRCTSDYEGTPEKYHWGMFDKTKKLSTEQIEYIISLAKIPRFTDQKVEIQGEKNVLTFVVESQVSGITRDWMMVESGMQQQAVGLVCAALGVGILFRNMGKDGTPISDTEYGSIKIKLDPMKPTYNGSFWSNLPPAGNNSWLAGNLPDPIRDGAKPLLTTLANLRAHNKSCSNLTEQSISQLLWATRGRTPHLYMSKPWGLTIPTWGGNQNISSVYLATTKGLQKYINWERKRPTNALSNPKRLNEEVFRELANFISVDRGFIVLGRNEDFARALWEVGYQLLNLLLQASSLGIS